MAYGDYNGPNKPDKGKENGSCNRTRCQCSPARWYNHGSYSWYCDDCRRDIEFDPINRRDWQLNYQPRLGHPQFETREMMDARLANKEAKTEIKSVDDFLNTLWEGEEHQEVIDAIMTHISGGDDDDN